MADTDTSEDLKKKQPDAPALTMPALATPLRMNIRTGQAPNTMPVLTAHQADLPAAQRNAISRESYAAGMPKLTAAPFSPDYYQQRENINAYEKANPWGSVMSSHPGIMGKIGHVASEIGQAAGNALVPGIMERIPGSELNRAVQTAGNEAGFNKAETEDTAKQEAAAHTASAAAQTTEAETGKERLPIEKEQADVEKYKAEHPLPKSPDEQAMQDIMGQVNPATGKNYSAEEAKAKMEQDAQAIRPQPYNIGEELHKEHPNWTPEQIQEATARASFPRILPVNDAKGNILGYNYFQGEPGGGVKTTFIPAGAGGAPTTGGAIPPKPGTSLIDQGYMAGGLQEMIQKNIFPAIDEAQRAGQMGPAKGRVQDFLLRRVGDPGSAAAYLQATLDAVPMMLGRIYGYRSAEYAKEYNDFLSTRMTPDALHAYLGGILAHAGTIQNLTGSNQLPEVGDIVDGWKFNGGNPADQNNWVKVKKQ